MRKLLLPLLAAGAITLPAGAQAQAPQHGLKTGNIVFLYTGEVLPGQMEAFRQLAPKVIATVAEEPGTLAYEWSMHADGKTFDSVEIYQDSNAVVAHVKDVVAKYGKDLGQVQKTIKLVVYGNPDEEAKKAVAGLNPEFETPIVGFIR